MTVLSVGRAVPLTRRHPWFVFIARRIVRLLVSLFVVITASFGMIHLIPGDPVRAALGLGASPSLIAARRHQLWLDRPLPNQYWHYLANLLHGDLGVSLVTGDRVSDIVRTRLPNTLAIALIAFVVAIAIAYAVGLIAAIVTSGRRRTRSELTFTTTTAAISSIPDFVLAAGLVAGLAVSVRWFPVAGKAGPESYVLPVLSLALAPAAVLARIVRVEALKTLGEDYMRTARAKRLPARLYYLRHATPNMVTASLTLAGNLLPAMIASTVLVEKVFAWPGIGAEIASSVTSQDYAVVQAVVLILGGAVLLANFVVDLLLAVLDPRSAIRES